MSYDDNESGYLVDLYKTEGNTVLGAWVMHANNYRTEYATNEVKGQAQEIVNGIFNNTGIKLDLSRTTNYLYFLDLTPFPETFALGNNGWIATHNGYIIDETSLIYPRGSLIPAGVDKGLEGVTFIPFRTTVTPTIMTPPEMKAKYNPDVIIEPSVIPDNPFVNPEAISKPIVKSSPGTEIDPEVTPEIDPEIDPGANPETDPKTDPETKLNFDPLKVSGNIFVTKFPFSLPFDLMNLVALFDVAPVAPTFKVDLKNFVPSDFKQNVHVVYELNFADYQLVIDILRWFILISFVAGLIKITSTLIKH